MDSTDRRAERQYNALMMLPQDLVVKGLQGKARELKSAIADRDTYKQLYEQRCSDLERALDLQRKALKEAREWRARYKQEREITGTLRDRLQLEEEANDAYREKIEHELQEWRAKYNRLREKAIAFISVWAEDTEYSLPALESLRREISD